MKRNISPCSGKSGAEQRSDLVHEASSSHAGIPGDRLLTRSEVEDIFGISKRYLETAVARGEGPVLLRIGRSVRYRTCDVQTWIEEMRVIPNADA